MKIILPLCACLALSLGSTAVAERLRVVATTTIVGDVVQAVGGSDIELTTLLGAGLDPHTFEPAPRDAAVVADADLLFINGGGLETFLEPLVKANRKGQTPVVDLSSGLNLAVREHAACEEHHDHEHEHHAQDPHVWLDPQLVQQWTKTIERVLTERDPVHAAVYQQRAEAYRAQLEILDKWIIGQLADLPENKRRFVTDHDEFGYFADRYGFAITGALLPNVSTATETSAKELAALESSIRTSGTRVLIVGNSVNPSLAQRVARDTGLTVVTLYTGALSKSGEPAATYLTFMRYNVEALFQALKKTAP